MKAFVGVSMDVSNTHCSVLTNQRACSGSNHSLPMREFSLQNPPIFSTVKLPFVKQVWEMDKETQAVGIACPVNQHCVVRFFRSKFGRL